MIQCMAEAVIESQVTGVILRRCGLVDYGCGLMRHLQVKRGREKKEALLY